MKLPIPSRDDPCWQNPAWRKQALLALVATHQLDRKKVIELTGLKPNTVRCIMSDQIAQAPGRATLRLLMLEVTVLGAH